MYYFKINREIDELKTFLEDKDVNIEKENLCISYKNGEPCIGMSDSKIISELFVAIFDASYIKKPSPFFFTSIDGWIGDDSLWT